MTHSILLAYHPSDSITMQQVRTLLQDNDFSVRLFDLTQTHLQPDTHDAVVILCSDEANQTSAITRMIDTVQSDKINKVFVLVRDEITSALPDGAQASDWIDVRDKRSVQANMSYLIKQLQSQQTQPTSASLIPNPLTIIGVGIGIIIVVIIIIAYVISPVLA